MALDLRNNFRAHALAGLMAVASLGAAFAPAANADNAGTPSTRPVSAQTVSYSQNAMMDATRWSKEHLDGVAIAVRFGTVPDVNQQQIEAVFRKDFGQHGVNNLKFFYDQNDALATGFTMHFDGATYGAYTIKDVRQNVQQVAQQVKFSQSHPELASN